MLDAAAASVSRAEERVAQSDGSLTISADGLVITAAVVGDEFVVTVAGEVDFATTRQSRTAPVLELYRGLEPRDVVVDLSDVGFLDSGGLTWLVRIRAAAVARGRRAYLRAPSPHAARVLLLSGVGRLFEGLPATPAG